MPLRQTVQLNPETVSDMLLAAEDRYREAEELLVTQEFDGAVYLLGYAAEIWLKAACLNLRGHGPVLPVKAALAPLKKWMATTAPSVVFNDYHDLGFLAECVIRLRDSLGRPLSNTQVTELRMHIANGLHNEWIVDMRYRRSGLLATDAWAALLQAWWMKTNWISLT
jgi:hypothetical protein